MTVTALPRPDAENGEDNPSRWKPSRAGVLNVWRYYDEIFEFHDGRLLLRGENGTGKSKALELLLPYLFDANLRANRLSTFGTNERTMHWNLMGEGASGTTRVGYVWIEFHREGDPQEWFSCGARLQASTNTTSVQADYFTVRTRIGTPDGVSLVNDHDQPLTRSALEEELGEHGTLHGNATEYRDAVRSTLFPGMNAQRFESLILALLQLRQPKLSQRLDPALLSTLLSRALPPLGDQEISELAEGFVRLDQQRERLARTEEEVQAAGALASRQRTYAQRVLLAASRSVTAANYAVEKWAQQAKQSEETYASVAAEKNQAEDRVEHLAEEITSTEGRIEGLTGSEAYRQGQQLDDLRRATEHARTTAEGLRAEADDARDVAAEDAATDDQAQQTLTDRTQQRARRCSRAQQPATRAGMTAVHEEITTSLESTDGPDPRMLLRAAVQSRRQQIAHVLEAVTEHEQAVRRRGEIESDLDSARSALTTAREHRAQAEQQREYQAEQLAARIEEWAGGCRELHFDNVADLVDASETTFLERVHAAAETVLHDLTADTATINGERTTRVAERERVSAEIEALRTEHDLPPTPPVTRETDRGSMPGAPLWRLVRFTESTSPDLGASVEAALQAGGLLDAWVSPSGVLAGHDVFVDPDSTPQAPERSLNEALVPEDATEVPETVVRGLLRSIAFGATAPHHPAAVGADGTWRLGNLTGSWAKDEPAHIGALARQRARQRRIDTLQQELATLEQHIAELDARLDALEARRQRVRHERSTRPGHDDLTIAIKELDRRESEVDSMDRVVQQRVDDLNAHERVTTNALDALTRLAAENATPTGRQALTALTDVVDEFASSAEDWLDSHRDVTAATDAARAASAQAQRSRTDADSLATKAHESEQHHHASASKLEAVERAVGADYREVLREVEQARNALRTRRRDHDDTQKKITELAQQLGTVDSRRRTDADQRDEAARTRDTAANRFRHLADTTLPADSGLPDLDRFTRVLSDSDGIRAALDAARLITTAWPSTPHEQNHVANAAHRLSEAVHTSRATLGSRADLDLVADEDVQLFSALVDGVRVGATELRERLAEEAERSRQDITEQERDLFDRTLTGATRKHLAERIRQAGELVDGMNARLEKVRTASSVRVQLVWQVARDLPTGTKEARDLLLKDPVRLTDDDRASLHRFFRDRIEHAKSDDESASWEEQLAKVFDYTRWHEFVVKVDRANGAGWQPLTKKLHGALSGGEKAIALHLPLFAAVAAHYQTVPEAPRVILLDEVFVGVDSTNRGQVFSLLSMLDLDLMLTSDHEWCTYPELAGIAIHQLIAARDGDDAVTTARFVWNGLDLVPDSA